MTVWVAYALAVFATALLVRHTATTYRRAPKRLPAHIGFDGRPSKFTLPRAVVWSGPAVLSVVLAILTVALLREPPAPVRTPQVALVFVIIAETAWLIGWAFDRQVEMARKMTYRIAPARLLLVSLPLLATIAATLAFAFY